MSAADRDERRVDLLVDAVTDGLSPTREAELATLLRGAPPDTLESYERAAAAVAIACAAADEAGSQVELPPALRERLLREADGVIAEARRAARRTPGASTTTSAATSVASLDESDELAARRAARAPARWGWLVAAAAVLLGVQSLRAHRLEEAASRAGAAADGSGQVAARWVCGGADASAPPVASVSADRGSGRLVLTFAPSASAASAPSVRAGGVYDCRPVGD